MLTPLTETLVAGRTPRSWISYVRAGGNVEKLLVAAETARTMQNQSIHQYSIEMIPY